MLPQEKHVFLSSLALAKTQDDKGRVRWSLFGASNDGPARGFWRSFFTAPDVEIPENDALDRIRKILAATYNCRPRRIARFECCRLSHSADRNICANSPNWNDGPLPGWTKQFRLDASDIAGCKYLLTFTPFALLPRAGSAGLSLG